MVAVFAASHEVVAALPQALCLSATAKCRRGEELGVVHRWAVFVWFAWCGVVYDVCALPVWTETGPELQSP